MAKKAVGKKEAAKKGASPKRAAGGGKIRVRVLGGHRVPYLGNATEGEVTAEQWSRLSRIKVNDVNIVERRD